MDNLQVKILKEYKISRKKNKKIFVKNVTSQ